MCRLAVLAAVGTADQRQKWVDICVDMHAPPINRHMSGRRHMRIDMCVDMRVDMRIDNVLIASSAMPTSEL